MSFAVAEADRRIAGIAGIGVVTAALADGTARVDMGGLVTQPLSVGKLRAGAMQVWWMPSVGEQVLVVAPSGDLARGVIVCSILASNAPSADTGTPTIDLRGGEMVIRGARLQIEADLEVTGRMDITGTVASGENIVAAGGIAAGGTAAVPGSMSATGDIHTTGDVRAGTISLTGHTHTGDSGGTTGAPS